MFTSQPGQTKDRHKNRKNCLLTWHAGVMVGVSQFSSTVLKAGYWAFSQAACVLNCNKTKNINVKYDTN